MPIYEYRCASCGTTHEVLQKISEAPPTACPTCRADALTKVVSAAGFHLKGSGWYATDFKNGSKPATKTETKAETASEGKPEASPATKTEAKSDTKSADAAPSKPAESKSAAPAGTDTK